MRFIIHVSAVVEHSGKIALVREGKVHSYGRWNLPGGHLEQGEELIGGAEREIREELGLEVSLRGFLGIYSGIGTDHCLNVIFTARAMSANFQNNAGDEILEQKWSSLSDVQQMDEEALLSPRRIRRIIADFTEREPYTLDCIGERLYASKPERS